ncbi:MAG: penicillin-binding transpeptidase domain-containing protein, partial [bacterium]
MLSRLLLPFRFLFQLFNNRLLLMRVLLLLIFVTFALRLAFLQVWTGKELHDVSTRNHLRWVRFPAPRGMILDRKGRVLATSTESRTAWLVSGEVPRKGWEALYTGLVNAGIFPNVEAARAGLEYTRKHTSYQPQRLMSDLDIAQTTRIEEELPYLPGVYLNTEPTRSYPGGALAAHLIGYLSEIDEKKLAEKRSSGYRAGDRIGKTGIESAFEDILRGQDGGEQLEVDVSGRVLHRYERIEPQPGGNITLTIDLDIQRAAEEGLKGLEGAVVALDPRTGDVLAIASTPAYDLNQMSTRITPEMMELFQQNHAMENRATSGYPPGSVFKIITATAALEKNLIPSDASYYCDGSY